MNAAPRTTRHAWAIYDFAITAFSMNVVSTYFALWVTKDHGAADLVYALAKSVSMALVIMLGPVLGAMSDRAGTRKPFLIATTLLMVLATGMLGLAGQLWQGLLLFGVANIAVQLAQVFYNAMLPTLVEPLQMGRLSGYGRALGYTGSLMAVFLGMAFATGKILGHPVGLPPGGSAAVFVPTALLVLLAALPLMSTREPAPAPMEPGQSHDAAAMLTGLRALRTDPELAGAGRFLLASFFFFDTVNTIRDFMSIYLTKAVGLSETGGSLQNFLAVVVLCSLVGALIWGQVADRASPKTALVGVLGTLFAGILGLVLVTSKGLVMGVLGPILGMAFGGVLVTTRPFLAQLIPADRQGLFFGMFVLANDAAAIVGPLLWGLVVKLLDGQGAIAYQAALASQLLLLAVGLLLVLRVPQPARTKQVEI